MKRPVGAVRIGNGASAKSDAKSETASDDIDRMINWCLAVNIDERTMDLIRQGYRSSANNECSLNQYLSYIRNNPLILDIVIKEPLQLGDTDVELAVWAGSALLKKRYHKWDTSMPMPAIVVDGHRWDYYIFFELDNNLVCFYRL